MRSCTGSRQAKSSVLSLARPFHVHLNAARERPPAPLGARPHRPRHAPGALRSHCLGAVAQWREDQATNLWLGYTRSPLQVPVGLISSVGISNPNGLVLISEILSRLPDPWVISVVLGMLQAALLTWVCWELTHKRMLFLIALFPLLTSILMRSASVELWAQWLLIPVNFLFFAGILLYLRHRTPWAIPLVAASMLLGPSLYLAGAVNAFVDLLIVVIVAIARPPQFRFRQWSLPCSFR